VRQARHLYLTVHDDGDRVLESRAVRYARSGDEEVLLVPDTLSDLTVVATAFNRLRQRSDLTQTRAAQA
jgi:hypothetical protein